LAVKGPDDLRLRFDNFVREREHQLASILRRLVEAQRQKLGRTLNAEAAELWLFADEDNEP
jgi:hypothetical protein